MRQRTAHFCYNSFQSNEKEITAFLSSYFLGVPKVYLETEANFFFCVSLEHLSADGSGERRTSSPPLEGEWDGGRSPGGCLNVFYPVGLEPRPLRMSWL